MSILKELTTMSEATDLTQFPSDVYHELEEHIHKGAKDLERTYANALELVKEAFKVEHVELPDPSMKKAWDQFTQLIHYATEKLLKFRGIDGDWRMSSHAFRESTEFNDYEVTVTNKGISESYIVRDEDIQSIVESTTDVMSNLYDVSVEQDGDSDALISFSKWSIKQPKSIKIQKITP